MAIADTEPYWQDYYTGGIRPGQDGKWEELEVCRAGLPAAIDAVVT